jgi:two-component system response regulator MtrA
MDPYTLVVIARTQSLARQLNGALDPAQYLVRWVPSTSQALQVDLTASLLILDAPPTGGQRSVAWLKRRFASPLLVLLRAETPPLLPADASVRHPFTVEQLVAQIQTTLMTCTPHVVQATGMSLDTKTHRLHIGGSLHQLRPTSSRILAALMAKPGEVIPREELSQKVWHTDEGDSTRALDVHVSHLRRVVEATPRYPEIIVTIRGVGYRLDPPSE